jgi:hypothetical protein
MDVVIVPPRHDAKGVYEDNRVWARQFVNANPESRAIVEMGGRILPIGFPLAERRHLFQLPTVSTSGTIKGVFSEESINRLGG